jgi:hypothetical protein
MTKNIEHSRRRGRFDPRYRVRRAVEGIVRKPLVGSDETLHDNAIRAWEDEGGAARSPA